MKQALKQHKLSMNCKRNFNQCELCGKKVSYKTRDKHINSASCASTRNINRYSELIGGYRIMDENILLMDVDFDGVIELETHEKQNIIITSKIIYIM